jgi:PAS domain S-box-containing protein
MPGATDMPPPADATAEPGLDPFVRLTTRLNEVSTVHQAAEVLAQTADALLGWDACSFDLITSNTQTVTCVLAMDLIGGQRTDVTPSEYHLTPTPMFLDVTGNGAKRIERQSSGSDTELRTFGDTKRQSSSLLFAPLRCGSRVKGVFTIQSYQPGAYAESSLRTLEVLASLTAGTIDRLQVESLLQRTEELYRRAIGGAGAVPYAYDYRANTYAFMGEGIRRLIGYAPHEINGELWARITREVEMCGEAAGLAKAEASRLVKSGAIQRWQCDMRVTTRQGKSRWLADSSVPHFDEAGVIQGSMGILQDITERKQAELSALALSRLGQSLVTAATAREVATLVEDAADQVFDWDASAFYLYLEERDEIQPVRYTDTIDGSRREVPPPAGRDRPGLINRRIISHGAELTLRDPEELKLDPDAEPFGDTTRPSASIMRVPIRLRASKVSGIVSFQSYTPHAYTSMDLKALQALADCCGAALERIWADDALRQSESQFRLLWESSEDGMRLINRDGIILRVNEAFCRMVRKPRRELEGHSMAVIHAASKMGTILDTHQKKLDSRTIRSQLEEEVALWNGERVWFELSNSLLEIPGKHPLVLSVFRDITRRKEAEEELDRMHKQLVEVSRQAGMAEVATSVLHNVGNVLNSVNVSGSVIGDKLRKSKVANLGRAVALLQRHNADLGNYLATDPKGRQLPTYLAGLAEALARENSEVLEELESLGHNIDHIKEIVMMQQSYAKVLGVVESLSPVSLVEDALRLNAGAMERHRVKVIREYAELPPILVDKHSVLQILVNLIRNAKYALDDRGHHNKEMTLRVADQGEDRVRIYVIDNGIGIARDHLTRIFEHGFTTRKEGHGFGLHNGALAARRLGGSLTAQSEGLGQGATFILELPKRAPLAAEAA